MKSRMRGGEKSRRQRRRFTNPERRRQETALKNKFNQVRLVVNSGGVGVTWAYGIVLGRVIGLWMGGVMLVIPIPRYQDPAWD